MIIPGCTTFHTAETPSSAIRYLPIIIGMKLWHVIVMSVLKHGILIVERVVNRASIIILHNSNLNL